MHPLNLSDFLLMFVTFPFTFITVYIANMGLHKFVIQTHASLAEIRHFNCASEIVRSQRLHI